ncbi:Unknown protein sequence [Pseudomonas amygdali pv. lachrymans]|uniref:Uncharacterized protein n=1 Tax=Pseudomonas amygdali pv. lachrymans TaxID=53707 RepID=A0ABR5KNW0_PSEAV|nr:Unknown protein sequence [Pseudomonas amygdali pv. lachrymans]KPC16412.1 Unknown protein sequence [Pseudomonas amygdali pv. lachrymans]
MGLLAMSRGRAGSSGSLRALRSVSRDMCTRKQVATVTMLWYGDDVLESTVVHKSAFLSRWH